VIVRICRRRSRSSRRWDSLILTTYLGVTLAAVLPAQAGTASGTINTIQQFAGSVGLAAIGAVFFAVLNGRGYAGTSAAVMWIGLGHIAVMAVLTRFVPGKPDVPAIVSSVDRSTGGQRDDMRRRGRGTSKESGPRALPCGTGHPSGGPGRV
jgi:hypothetical protein